MSRRALLLQEMTRINKNEIQGQKIDIYKCFCIGQSGTCIKTLTDTQRISLIIHCTDSCICYCAMPCYKLR